MTKEMLINEINAIMNLPENDDILTFHCEKIGVKNFRVEFANAITGDNLDFIDENGDNAYDRFDLQQMRKNVELISDQLDVIMREVKLFAKTNPSVGQWIKGGIPCKCDFGRAYPFRYEVTRQDRIITVYC